MRRSNIGYCTIAGAILIVLKLCCTHRRFQRVVHLIETHWLVSNKRKALSFLQLRERLSPLLNLSLTICTLDNCMITRFVL